MVEDFKVELLLLNLFFILFPLIFYQFVHQDRLKAKSAFRNLLLFFIFTPPIWLCMIFSVNNEDGFLTNMHSTGLLLACYYSNPLVSGAVFLSTLAGRLLLGGDGQYLTYIGDTLLFGIALLSGREYKTMRLFSRIASNIVLAFGSKLCAVLLFSIFDPACLGHFHYMFYLMECLFMALAVYTIEAIQKNMQLKQELLDTEKIKVASVISASVAHEIRNPLTSVRGFIQLLYETEGLSADKKKLYGHICLEELDRAQQIINDYLSLARPHPDLIEKIDLAEEVSYVSTVLTSYANLKGVELRVETEPGLFVSGDRQRLRQSMLNIGKNGIEAMEQGGVLDLRAKREGKEVLLLICDTGAGMTNEEVSRLGTPYFSTKDKGTGLGTLVSFNIIKNMLGKIKVESKVGVGTSFHISFPASGRGGISNDA